VVVDAKGACKEWKGGCCKTEAGLEGADGRLCVVLVGELGRGGR
jgi:hypothetical protein